MANETRIGIALSGGGHRATLFGLGVLLYLADHRKNRQVTAISSVSGGSLTNAYVAQEADFSAQTPDEFAALAGRLAQQIAQRGTLWAGPRAWIYVAVTVIAAIGVFSVWWLPWHWLARLAVFIIALLVWSTGILSQRGFVCGRAYARTLLCKNGRATKLSEWHQEIDHVICATELHSGRHIYFSSRFVYNWQLGWGRPEELPSYAAAQASTALPGAFPPRWFRRSRFGFQGGTRRPWFLATLDGGLYDNMADQWLSGLRNRQHGGEFTPTLRSVDEAVVVNCSAGMKWKSVARLGMPIVGELFALLKSVKVMYENSASLRRKGLVAIFDHNAARRAQDPEAVGLTGALVDISQSPYRIPRAFEHDKEWEDRMHRAAYALERLGELGISEASWQRVAEQNSDVTTTLMKLGTDTSASLMHHAYVLAAVNLHVILGYPLKALPPLSRFVDLSA